MSEQDDMTVADAIQTLKAHQCWRMGADVPQISPRSLSRAINMIIEYLEEEEAA